jgi:hypothetical protein
MGKMKALGWVILDKDNDTTGSLYESESSARTDRDDLNSSELPVSKPYRVVKVYIKQKSKWIDWAGGDCPVEAMAKVKVKFRGGDKSADWEVARSWMWAHQGGTFDIVAYKLKGK